MTADFTSCTQHGDLGWKYMGDVLPQVYVSGRRVRKWKLRTSVFAPRTEDVAQPRHRREPSESQWLRTGRTGFRVVRFGLLVWRLVEAVRRFGSWVAEQEWLVGLGWF